MAIVAGNQTDVNLGTKMKRDALSRTRPLQEKRGAPINSEERVVGHFVHYLINFRVLCGDVPLQSIWKGPINTAKGRPPVFQNASTGEISAEPPSGWQRGVEDQIALGIVSAQQ